MSYIKYEVHVSSQGTKSWHLNGKLHREDGPAVEYSDGTKHWYLNDLKYSESDYRTEMNTCDGKTVVIDGKEYRLHEVKK